MEAEAEVSEQNVCDLTDLLEAFQLIRQLDVNPRGITDLDGAKCRLLRHLSETAGDDNTQIKVRSCIICNAFQCTLPDLLYK